MGNDIFLTEIDMPCMLQPNRDSSDLFFGSLKYVFNFIHVISTFCVKTGEMVNQIMSQNTNVDQEFGCVYGIQKLNLHKVNGR